MYRNDALQESEDWPHKRPIMAKEGFLYHVHPEYIHSISDMLFSVIDDGVPFKADAAQIKRLCEEGQIGVYVGYGAKDKIESILLLQLMISPEEKVLRVVFMWGNIGDKWAEYWDSLRELGRHLQVNAIEGFGREGFKRWGKAVGLVPMYTLFRAEV